MRPSEELAAARFRRLVGQKKDELISLVHHKLHEMFTGAQ